MKSNQSESTTAYFSVHVTCPTVYRGQIVSTAVCPTWCTYLYQEREKNRPPLENTSRSPLVSSIDQQIWETLSASSEMNDRGLIKKSQKYSQY